MYKPHAKEATSYYQSRWSNVQIIIWYIHVYARQDEYVCRETKTIYILQY